MFDANHDIAIGAVARVPQLGENFNGLIDEVAIWNEALDADAIAAVYKNGVIPAPSDLTGNGFVDFEDLTVLLANWNKEVGADAGNLVNPTTTPVNFEDLTVLLADWTGPGPAGSPEAALGEAVPEPSTLLLALFGLLSAVCCRRRRRP